MRFALQHQDVGAARLCQMISDTGSNNAAADYHYIRGFGHDGSKLRSENQKVKSKTERRLAMPQPEFQKTRKNQKRLTRMCGSSLLMKAQIESRRDKPLWQTAT